MARATSEFSNAKLDFVASTKEKIENRLVGVKVFSACFNRPCCFQCSSYCQEIVIDIEISSLRMKYAIFRNFSSSFVILILSHMLVD